MRTSDIAVPSVRSSWFSRCIDEAYSSLVTRPGCCFFFLFFFFFKLPFPGELSQQKTKQLYQMARQCLERSESLSDSLRATHGAEAAQKQHVPVTPPVPAPRRLVAWTGDPRGTLSSSIVQASIAQPLAATQHSVPLVAVQRQPQVTKQVSQPR